MSLLESTAGSLFFSMRAVPYGTSVGEGEKEAPGTGAIRVLAWRRKYTVLAFTRPQRF